MSHLRQVLSAFFALALASSAQAEAPVVGTTARVPDAARLELFGGTRDLGAGVLLPTGPHAVGAELAFNPWDRVLQARAQRIFTLVRWEHFGLSAGAGAALLAPTQGPVDLGVGPHGSLTAGWGWKHVSLDIGAQAGAELFVRAVGVRFPLRLLAGLGLQWGAWGVGLMGRTGADLERGAYPTLRYEALLFLRWGGWGPRREGASGG